MNGMPPLIFPPAPSDSNYGFTLAGYIVERVSGEKFERYIENHILKPLGMNNSTFDQPLPPQLRRKCRKVISARPKSRAISNGCKRRQLEHSPQRLLT